MKSSVHITTAFVFILPLLIQCSKVGEGPATPAERAAARVAKDYVAVRFPDFDAADTRLVFHENVDAWQFEYELPKGTIGGTPVVVIDKETMKVVRSFHTQ